jgi:hypothetical protein
MVQIELESLCSLEISWHIVININHKNAILIGHISFSVMTVDGVEVRSFMVWYTWDEAQRGVHYTLYFLPPPERQLITTQHIRCNISTPQ